MKTNIKQVIKWIGTGVATALGCMVLLVASSLIPQELIRDNVVKSADYFANEELFQLRVSNLPGTMQDNYADCILTNIIYHIDSSNPVSSTLKASYYNPLIQNVNVSLLEAVTTPQEPNVDYFRYWHGSMVLIRPLLMFMDISGVRLVLGIAVVLLAIVAAVLLFRRKEPALAVIYLISLVLVDVWMPSICLEYVTTFLVMGVALLLLICKAGKSDKASYYIPFFISFGVVTAFVDFLTTETITYTIPMVALLVILYRSNQLKSVKESLKLTVATGISWIAGYAGMFACKWILAAGFFGVSALKESIEMAALRVGGEVTLDNTNIGQVATWGQKLVGALARNMGCLLHVDASTSLAAIQLIFWAVVLILLGIVYLFHLKEIPGTLYVPLGLLAVLPYLRYLTLSNHSFLHYFFTYRAQIVTVVVLLLIVWENAIPGIIHICRGKNR